MRQNDYLKYINYPIIQDSEMFKVNSDTAALGMFLDPLKGKTVLDLGTNNGALLLYAHYKKAGKLIGVDIFKEVLEVANENLKHYSDNYTLIHSRIQDLNIEPVDVVICNPPFFEMGNVRANSFYKTAMFEETLPLEDMFKAFRKNMKDNGEVYTLYPAERFNELFEMCLKYKLKIMKMVFVHDENRPYASRVIMKLKIGPMKKVKVLKPIMIRKGDLDLSGLNVK